MDLRDIDLLDLVAQRNEAQAQLLVTTVPRTANASTQEFSEFADPLRMEIQLLGAELAGEFDPAALRGKGE